MLTAGVQLDFDPGFVPGLRGPTGRRRADGRRPGLRLARTHSASGPPTTAAVIDEVAVNRGNTVPYSNRGRRSTGHRHRSRTAAHPAQDRGMVVDRRRRFSGSKRSDRHAVGELELAVGSDEGGCQTLVEGR